MEQINLNLIPTGVTPVCHVSQYDTRRKIRLNLFDGANAFVIGANHQFQLQVRKPDNTIVTDSVSHTISNSYVDIITTEQETAVFGTNLCQLQIKDTTPGDASTIGTLNFIMEVEPDVLANGDPSQSEIHDLPAMVDALLTPYKYKDYTGTLLEGETTLNITSDPNDTIFTPNSTLDFYTSVYGVNPINVQIVQFAVGDDGYTQAQFTFEAQTQNIHVKVRAYT